MTKPPLSQRIHLPGPKGNPPAPVMKPERGALDQFESWLSLEDPFDARAEAWAEPDLDCDAGPALSV